MNHIDQSFRGAAYSKASLEDAIALVEEHMHGKERNNGSPATSHLHCVLALCTELNPGLTEDQKIACILHDAIEDEYTSAEELRELGFSEKVISLVETLSRRTRNEKYIDFVRRISLDPDAIPIKIADMKHNSQDRPKDGIHYRRYQLCIQYLEAIQRGEVEPGAPIEYALSPQQILDNIGIIAKHQTITPYTSPLIFGYDP